MRNCDVAKGWQVGRQEPATPVAEGIRRFHNDRMRVRRAVTVFVSWMLARTVIRFEEGAHRKPTRVVHGTRIEVVWTRRPARRLVGIAVPSFTLLYSVDERVEPARTVKVVGHQWYWTYEYAEREEGSEFESYMLPEEERAEGARRRLEVDKRRRRPMETHMRRIVTAADVLHSWAVPAFGVKIDACPGRLNQVARYVSRPGVYYGQCSEICGVNHGFMPIVVEVSTVRGYRNKMAVGPTV
jgi:cytochrome c oxidase subunit 2